MSKMIAQAALSVLLGLGVIVGFSSDLQSRLSHVLLKSESSAQVHVVNGLQTNFRHFRSSVGGLNQAELQLELQSPYQSDKPHGCESESKTDPND